MTRIETLLLASLLLLPAACTEDPTGPGATPSRSPTPTAPPSTAPAPTPTPTAAATEAALPKGVTERPKWLGKRVLPLRADGFGVPQPTPPILRNRRFTTIDYLPAPDSKRFVADIGPVPASVLKRSTWREICPVTPEQLSYIRMTFWGFDHLPHTGEMIVNASVADDVVQVFEQIYRARYPIEEMRVVTLREQRGWRTHPTGDTNVTSSFECRDAAESSSWSQHAYGLAIDINPFHNPYLNGGLVAPELASVYTDRTWERPGMILEGDAITQAFDAIGWGWGGRWNSLKDWMHFSASGS